MFCPKCGKDLIHWKKQGSNTDLHGNKTDNMKRIKPICPKCKVRL